jgi:hypothetical protein
MYVVDGRRLCEPCATKRATEMRASGREPEVLRSLDPTICAECGADKGDTEWLKVAGTPLCFRCRQRFYEVPFPAWVLLLLLLMAGLAAFAAWHGWQYAESGIALANGQRFLAQERYGAAATEFHAVLEQGSESDRVLLLAAKAYLLAGDYEHARRLLNGHARFNYTGTLFFEVQGIWDRAVKAEDLAAEAEKLAPADPAAAAAKMREAAAAYPERADLATRAQQMTEQAGKR